MRDLVSARMSGLSLRALETVEWDTPASRAISLIETLMSLARGQAAQALRRQRCDQEKRECTRVHATAQYTGETGVCQTARYTLGKSIPVILACAGRRCKWTRCAPLLLSERFVAKDHAARLQRQCLQEPHPQPIRAGFEQRIAGAKDYGCEAEAVFVNQALPDER